MKTHDDKAWYIGRRGELLAEEFLLELGATYVGALQQPHDSGLDCIALFAKDDGTPIVIAVQVKATEQDINVRSLLPPSLVQRLQHTNVPVLILLVNVKHNDIYFTWASDARPTTRLRQATPEEKAVLKQEIHNPRVKVLD